MEIEEYRKRFGSLIARRRIEVGIPVAHIAKELGVSQPAVYQWERGTNLPDTENRMKLATLLDQPFDDASVKREPIRDFELNPVPRQSASSRLPLAIDLVARPDTQRPLDVEIRGRIVTIDAELAEVEARRVKLVMERRRLEAALEVFVSMDVQEDA